MSQPTKTLISVEEYLTAEYHGEQKHEYRSGEVVAMAGAQPNHVRITQNLTGEVYAQTKDSPCETFGSDMMVYSPGCDLYTYPDFSLVCGSPTFAKTPWGVGVLLNPQVIVEVLSRSTELYDRSEKFRCYQAISSLQQYVLIAQDKPLVDSFTRQPTGWLQQTFAEGDFPLAGFTVTLQALYRRVDFNTATEEQ